MRKKRHQQKTIAAVLSFLLLSWMVASAVFLFSREGAPQKARGTGQNQAISRPRQCNESAGMFESADGGTCVPSCALGEVLRESRSGAMSCQHVSGERSSAGAFVALHVYAVGDPEGDRRASVDLVAWLRGVAQYNSRFGTCYDAVVFHHGPALAWRVARAALAAEGKDWWPPHCPHAMTSWVDVSSDDPFGIPEQARRLGVTRETIGSRCHGVAWPAAYAFMIRFRVGLMWAKDKPYWPVVAQFRALFQLDEDCTLDGILADAIAALSAARSSVGFYACAYASASCTEGSSEFVASWAAARNMTWPRPGSLPKSTVFMGGMVLYDPHFFASSEAAMSLLAAVDASGLIYERRWPEHLFYAIVPHLIGRGDSICFVGDLFDVIHHGKPYQKQTCKGREPQCVLRPSLD